MTTERPRAVDLVRKEVRALKAYEEEASGGLNLMANTNLFGQNPAVPRALERMQRAALGEYPSLTSLPLREAVAAKLRVDPAMVVTGNGSNDLIDVVCRAFAGPGDRVAFHPPSFSMIPAFIRLNHAVPVPVPLGDGWALDADALAAADAKVTFVVRPNNPTGNAFPRKDIESLLERVKGVVVIDEAYVEFLGGDSFAREVAGGVDRLVVLRTFSKAHGLAGFRIGYAVCAPDVAPEMGKVRGPFRLSLLSEMAGVLALEDDAFVDATVAAVRAERPRLQRMLEERGFRVWPSDANFLFTKPPVLAVALAAELASRGIFVRDFGGELGAYTRFTVGPASATDRLREALDEVLPELRRRR